MSNVIHHCRSCRHTHKEERDRVVNTGGGFEDVLEQCATHDGSSEDIMKYGPDRTEDVFHCTKQADKVIGIGDDAGVDCPMWEAGVKGKATLPPELERRLADFDARHRE